MRQSNTKVVTNKDLTLEMYGFKFTVPKGTSTTHPEALGGGKPHVCINDFDWINKQEQGLKHNAWHYGINIKIGDTEEVNL